MMTTTQPTQPIKRGDIALVLFPNSDLVSAKTRPVLIVQADNLHTGLSQVIVAEEYLELEVNSDTRNEYCNGEIIPMTGGTPNHNDIAGNLYILLKSSLRGKEYRTFYVDQRLWIPSVNLYTYD